MQAVMMKMLWLTIISSYMKSDQKLMDKYQKPLPHFRLKMEENFNDQESKSVAGNESSDNFVSFLVDNVKELFVRTEKLTTLATYDQENFDSASLLDIFKTSTDAIRNKESPANKIIPNNSNANNSLIIDNNYYLRFLRRKNDVDYSKLINSNETSKQLLHLLKKLEIKKNETEQDNSFKLKRTCIACNNLVNKECNNPKFKLVPSVDCQHEDDLCYSQHTPFGMIDRGCFNVNHNRTMFVCACNLCNYISISEMPYMFSNKRDWIQNIIELSHAKRLRESILKDMSCLRCEVNVTSKKGDLLDDTNCLEGNIASLPRQICSREEICAVLAIRSEGYIWRGCVREPLYNYWWTLCGYDWCNYDSVVSIYENLNYID